MRHSNKLLILFTIITLFTVSKLFNLTTYSDTPYLDYCLIESAPSSNFFYNDCIEKIPEPHIVYQYDEKEVNIISKIVYGEARGLSKTAQSAVVWCILNRVDSVYYGDTITEVALAKAQFHYKETFPVKDEITEIVKDVLYRWYCEKDNIIDVGRTLPQEYTSFYGNGTENIFRDRDGNVWHWSWGSPYN